jgi:hypothetical protein
MPNKMSKLKDQVKELDYLFVANNLEKFMTSTSSRPENELTNSFFSPFGSNLSKMIWLSPSRLLLVMQDATLVWLVIDAISGDIFKMLTDKTLTQSFGHNSAKLSGQFICDVVLVSKSEKQSPILALAYLDKSKIDLISFNKPSQINDYLNNGSGKKLFCQTLEKLAAFDPVMASYEFSCPNFTLTEKRFSSLASDISPATFCLWWPNDGQQAFTLNSQPPQHTISLLEREDLRSNVLCLSTNLSDSNLIEYLYKSDGHLLSLSYLDKSSLIAVEQVEMNPNKYAVIVFKYDISSGVESEQKPRAGKTKLVSFHMNSKIASIEQVKHGRKFVLMLSSDQTLVLYDISRNLVFKHR